MNAQKTPKKVIVKRTQIYKKHVYHSSRVLSFRSFLSRKHNINITKKP
jgi:hypothetical protein